MFPLKILTWNIEHFNGTGGKDSQTRQKRLNRLNRVVDLIKTEKPDVFGISEVSSGFVYEKMVAALPTHTFHITTGRQSQEILIGVRDGLGSFFTQKDEFKRNNIYLRPGALLTVHANNVHVPILFVHLKSMPSPEGFGLRDAMFDQIYSLKRALDKAAVRLSGKASSKANFVVLGDYNTMGFDYYHRANDIPKEREIEVLTSKMKTRKMRKATTSHPHTYFNGSNSSYPPSELDHVFVAQHMKLKESAGVEVEEGGWFDNLGSRVGISGVEVEVGGWAKMDTDSEKDDWIEKFSDHAPLIFTITGV